MSTPKHFCNGLTLQADLSTPRTLDQVTWESNYAPEPAEIIHEPILHLLTLPLLFLPAAAAAAKSLQSCLTLCDLTDSSPPGSSVPGILQARTLEWVAISFSNA